MALEAVQSALRRVAGVTEAMSREAERGEDWAAGELDAEGAVGDLLFAVVALARRLRVNPEEALRARAMRFAQRFRALESRAREEGVDLHDLDEAAWLDRWGSTAG
jgi:ATP diphosphatase